MAGVHDILGRGAIQIGEDIQDYERQQQPYRYRELLRREQEQKQKDAHAKDLAIYQSALANNPDDGFLAYQDYLKRGGTTHDQKDFGVIDPTAKYQRQSNIDLEEIRQGNRLGAMAEQSRLNAEAEKERTKNKRAEINLKNKGQIEYANAIRGAKEEEESGDIRGARNQLKNLESKLTELERAKEQTNEFSPTIQDLNKGINEINQAINSLVKTYPKIRDITSVQQANRYKMDSKRQSSKAGENINLTDDLKTIIHGDLSKTNKIRMIKIKNRSGEISNYDAQEIINRIKSMPIPKK